MNHTTRTSDETAQMLLATGVVLLLSLLSMAVFSVKVAGLTSAHEPNADSVIETTKEAMDVLPSLTENRTEIWIANGVERIEAVTTLVRRRLERPSSKIVAAQPHAHAKRSHGRSLRRAAAAADEESGQVPPCARRGGALSGSSARKGRGRQARGATRGGDAGEAGTGHKARAPRLQQHCYHRFIHRPRWSIHAQQRNWRAEITGCLGRFDHAQ